jgi:hypothetical protein
MQPARFATLTSARPDPPGGLGLRTTNAALRAEALHQLRWQQREWGRLLATHAPSTLPLIAFADPAGFTVGLDLLREAGDDVPSWLYRLGARERTTEGVSGTTRVSLTELLADLTKALALLDPAPNAWDQDGSVVHHPDPIVLRALPTPSARGEGASRQIGHHAPTATWKPTDEGHEAAAGEWTVGDHVAARANAIKVRTGSRGTVVGFSSVGGHPLVDFAGSGLVLIRAEHLERDDDSTPEVRPAGGPRSSGMPRLSDTPRPPAVAAAPSPPPPDWFDRPPDAQGTGEFRSTR